MRRVIPTAFPEDPFVIDSEMLGRAVRAARTQSGMTLEDAALSLGVSKQTLQDFEKGTGGVSLAKALHIMQGLGVSLFAVPARERNLVAQAIKAGVRDGA